MEDDTTSASPSEVSESTPPIAFDLASKLTQRLSAHTAERTHQKHLVDTYTTQLSNLIKTTPKKPRDSKPVLVNKIAKLEKDRVQRSMSLSQEKALLREIATAQKSLRQFTALESHQESIWRKRAELESAKETLRVTDSNIAEINKVLATVQLAKRLGCTTAELVTRECTCSVDKMNGVLLEIKDLIGNAESFGVCISVDRIHGKFVVKGGESAVCAAIGKIEEVVNSVDEEILLNGDQIVYLQQCGGVLVGLREDHSGVRFDFLARLNRIVLTGGPLKVGAAKRDLLERVNVVSRVHGGLDGRQASTVVGKQGGVIHELSTRHGVVMNLSKDDGGETSSLRIVGPSKQVDATLQQVTTLLHDNEQIKESFTIDKIMKSELIQNSGASIKEFENSVGNAVSAPVFLTIERNVDKDAPPTLTLKCQRSVMDRAKSLVTKKIREFESNIITMSVPTEIIPAIIGKGGSKIESLQNLGGGASVEADKSGTVKIYSHDPESRQTVKDAVQKIIDENQIGYVDVEKKSLGFLFGDPGKETMASVAEIGCTVSTNDNEDRLLVRGTKENIAKASKVLKEFMDKNYVLEVDIHAEDEVLLFSGGEKSLLHLLETKHDVKPSFRKERGVLLIRGEVDKTAEAKKEVETFLYGGEGIVVIKFKVPEDAIGSIVGKGGSNLAKLETDFEGVRVHIPKNNNLVSLRGPEESVKKCRVHLITEIAIFRVSDSLDLTPAQHSDLSNNVDLIKKTAGTTNTSIALNEGSVKIRGVSRDVRDAKALLKEHFTGSYSGYIDLEASQYTRLKSTTSKDSSHFERVKSSTGANVVIDETESVIKITGKKANVKKAKLSLMGFLDFIFPKHIQTVKVHKTLFKSMGDPEKLAEISAATGASVYLDRDLISVVINGENSDDATKAVKLVNARLVESEKLNYVFRLLTTDSWLLPVIIGKGGQNVKKIEADTECTIDIFKDELTVVVRAQSEEAVVLGKGAIEAIVDQARKECVFVDLPESAIAQFVGKGGAHIKQMSSDHDVEIEKTKKQPSTIKITGKEENVANAKDAALSWLSEWEASHIGLTINVEDQFIPAILGKGGETVRSIQKDTKCRIDVDRSHSTLTVREGTESDRKEAMSRVQAIIDKEKALAAERAAEKEKLRLEQAEMVRNNAKTREVIAPSEPPPQDTNESDISGIKDRTKEFQARPVGMAASKPKGGGSNMDAIETGTKEGRELYLMLISGEEDQDDQWDSSTVSSSAAMISVCDSNFGGENDLHYRSISGFTVRI